MFTCAGLALRSFHHSVSHWGFARYRKRWSSKHVVQPSRWEAPPRGSRRRIADRKKLSSIPAAPAGRRPGPRHMRAHQRQLMNADRPVPRYAHAHARAHARGNVHTMQSRKQSCTRAHPCSRLAQPDARSHKGCALRAPARHARSDSRAHPTRMGRPTRAYACARHGHAMRAPCACAMRVPRSRIQKRVRRACARQHMRMRAWPHVRAPSQMHSNPACRRWSHSPAQHSCTCGCTAACEATRTHSCPRARRACATRVRARATHAHTHDSTDSPGKGLCRHLARTSAGAARTPSMQRLAHACRWVADSEALFQSPPASRRPSQRPTLGASRLQVFVKQRSWLRCQARAKKYKMVWASALGSGAITPPIAPLRTCFVKLAASARWGHDPSPVIYTLGALFPQPAAASRGQLRLAAASRGYTRPAADVPPMPWDPLVMRPLATVVDPFSG